jgi:hypothetical protein
MDRSTKRQFGWRDGANVALESAKEQPSHRQEWAVTIQQKQ